MSPGSNMTAPVALTPPRRAPAAARRLARLRPTLSGALVPAVLAAVYGVVQWRFLRPVSGQDGMIYFEAARDFPDVALDHRTLRIGLLIPVRLSQWLFGYSEVAYYLVPFAAGALFVVATYSVGRRLFSPAVGIAAAVTLLLSDVFLMVSSVLLPDLLGAALFMLGLAVVLAAVDRAVPSRHLLVVASLTFAWAYLVREYVALLFPMVAVVFLVYRVPWRNLRWVAFPAAAVLVGEVVLNGVVHGSPFARLIRSGGHGGQRDSIADTRWDALVRLPRALLDNPGGFVLVVLLALTVAGMLVVRRPHFRIVGAWVLLFWVPLTLGTGLVVPDFRFLIADKLRYWMPVLPAIVIGGVALVDASLGWGWNRVRAWRQRTRGLGAIGEGEAVRAVAVVLLALLLAGAGLADSHGRESFRVNGADEMAEVRDWFEGPGQSSGVVWTDPYTARILPLYARSPLGEVHWSGAVRPFVQDGEFVDPALLRGGAIVLYRYGYRLLEGGYARLPEYLRRRDQGRQVDVFREDRSLVILRLPS